MSIKRKNIARRMIQIFLDQPHRVFLKTDLWRIRVCSQKRMNVLLRDLTEEEIIERVQIDYKEGFPGGVRPYKAKKVIYGYKLKC